MKKLNRLHMEKEIRQRAVKLFRVLCAVNRVGEQVYR